MLGTIQLKQSSPENIKIFANFVQSKVIFSDTFLQHVVHSQMRHETIHVDRTFVSYFSTIFIALNWSKCLFLLTTGTWKKWSDSATIFFFQKRRNINETVSLLSQLSRVVTTLYVCGGCSVVRTRWKFDWGKLFPLVPFSFGRLISTAGTWIIR